MRGNLLAGNRNRWPTREHGEFPITAARALFREGIVNLSHIWLIERVA